MPKGREILWEKVDKLVKDIKENRPVLEILRGNYTEAQIREAEKKLAKTKQPSVLGKPTVV